MNTDRSPPNELTDQQLLNQVEQLAFSERKATARLIASLAELDARRLYLGEGYSSLFVYCTSKLHLSEHAAYGRIEAARIARRVPAVLERLTDGSITLTNLGLLAPHLTPRELRRATGGRQVQEQARGRRTGRSAQTETRRALDGSQVAGTDNAHAAIGRCQARQ